MNKKTISIILLIAMSLTMLPMAALAGSFADVSFVREHNAYFFEDFSKIDGRNVGGDGNLGGASIGYYANGYKIDNKSYSNTAPRTFGDNLALGSYNNTDSFVVVGPRGKSTTGKNDEYEFNIDAAHFEDAGNAIVFSYDLYVPYSTNAKTGMQGLLGVNCKLGTTNYDFNGQSHISRGAELISGTGGQYFAGRHGEFELTGSVWTVNATDKGGSNLYINIPKGGSKWINVANVIQYDKDEKAYITTYYIDGEPIKCTSGDDKGEIAKLVVKPSDAFLTQIKDNRDAMYFQIAKSGGMDTEMAIDNVSIKLYSGTTVDSYMSAAESETSLDIPVYNTYSYSSDAPSGVKEGIFVPSSLEADGGVVINKYSADDKLLVNGEKLTKFNTSTDGNVIKLTNVPQRSTGEILSVDLSGLKSANGVVDNNKVLVAPGSDFKGIVGRRFKDASGNEIELTDVNAVSPAAMSLELDLVGVTSATMESSAGATYTASNGVFDFSKTPLKTNTTYTIKLDGTEYVSFKTVETGSLEFGSFAANGGSADIAYVNTFDDSMTAYAVVMHYDAKGKFVGGSASEKTFPATSSGTMSVPLNKPEGASYNKVVIVDTLTTAKPLTEVYVSNGAEVTSAAAVSDKKFEAASFDNDGTAVAKGDTGLKKACRLTAVLLDSAGNLVYANDLKSAADGTYTFNIDMTDTVATGTYKMYLSADGSLIANGVNVYYSKDASEKLAEINGATTKEDVAEIIESSQADLEFYYDEYYASFTPEQKLMVADIILGEKNELKEDNGTGFDTADKAAATEVFKNSVIMTAVSVGTITSYEKVENAIESLQSGVIYNWIGTKKVSTTKNIKDSLRKSWQSAVIGRLKGAEFTSVADFTDKVYASLLFSCVANPDGFGNIKEMTEEFIDGGYIENLSKTYVTNDVCPELVGRNYTGYEYTTYVSDIKKIYADIGNGNNNTNTNKPSGFGGGGGGGSSYTPSDNKTEVLEPIAPAENEKSYAFSDISDSWAKDIITELADKNIIGGNGDGTFAPDDNITREEFTAIIVRMLGLEAKSDAEMSFGDVTLNDWYYDTVRIANQHGIINGKSDAEFGSGENIRRQDMAVILKNVLDMSAIEYENKNADFKDLTEVDDYAADAVGILSGMSIINGYEDNTFRPYGMATRAEAAKVVYGIMQILGK